jgi:penicillin-binding protein 1C
MTKKRVLIIGCLFIVISWLLGLPHPLFDRPYATVIEDSKGELLGARIAADGQWRFPPGDSLPVKFLESVKTFEDQRFWQHPGIDLRAFVRAIHQNIRAGKIVSGASTLDMQVIRLARGQRPRNLWQKVIEMALALRLQLSYDKSEIFQFWASQASFGGNVVGIEAASWRYYSKPPHLLSWAEAATLAVLPNSPSLIHPGRNRSALQNKRDRLLKRLLDAQLLSNSSYQTALLEPIPDAPLPLPQLAPQLLQQVVTHQGPGRWRTTIQADLQEQLYQMARQYQANLAANGIHNLAILVLDNEAKAPLAYIGNLSGLAKEHSPDVDLIQAPRSPGSLLKPVLYGLAMESGLLLPKQFLPDVPSVFGGFRPENFHQSYSGAVPAQQALARSLNLPFVHLLQDYGVGPFHQALQHWSFGYINQPADHYGLSLILGGCEVSLWEISNWYSGLALTLLHYRPLQSRYAPSDWQIPSYLSKDEPLSKQSSSESPLGIGAGAAWATIGAMEQLERPGSEGNWQAFTSSRRLAWKTGTSFGFRDAWAIGISPRFTIGVWVGNADGEGRPGLVGVQAAAPLLFAVQRRLPNEGNQWFEPPYDDLEQLVICSQTGYLARDICPVDTIFAPTAGARGQVCPHHILIHTNEEGNLRLNSECVSSTSELHPRSWLVLPSLQAYYYRLHSPDYTILPPWRSDCQPSSNQQQPLAWIYPSQSGRIKIPRTWDGQLSAVVFSIAHQQEDQNLHWHLDQQYLTTTSGLHTVEIQANKGPHRLLVEDEKGNRIWRDFVLE